MMNTSTISYFKNIKIRLFLLLISAVIFNSCGKSDTDTTISYLRIVNASPALATYNVYLNGSIINSAALPFAGAVSYSSRTAGTYSLKFTTASTVESLLTKDITLNQSTYHTFYLVNKPGQLDGYTTSDDLSIPSTDKAYIRFINLSPDAPALDLIKTGTTTSYGTNKAYKTAGAFVTVDAGTYSLDVKETTSGTIKITKTDAIFTAGYHYDIIFGGMVKPANDTERPISLQVLTIK